MKKHMLGKSIQLAMLLSSVPILHYSPQAIAQQANAEDLVEKIQVTGTRIRSANALSSSPILTIGEQEIEFQQQVEIERVLRNLPATIPGDNANVNNGTGGAATVNLRALGTNRNLVLMDGKRMVPFNTTGSVDTSTIPTALIKSIDIVTGGASAVYGSDAISGAVNIILKDDFEGVELNVNHNRSEEGDALSDSIALTVGGNFDNGKGNAVVSVSWLDRDGLLLGDRALGQFGIDTASGGNYQNFLDGATPAPPSDPGCTGDNVVAVGGGSPNGIPTIIALSGVPSVSGQFRDDRSLVFGPLSARCSDFNFNPFNFYQTPSNRYSATAKAQYEVYENANVYTTINFTNTSVLQQVAPSGLFGNPFFVPLANPFLGANAQAIIDGTNAAVNAQLASGNPSPLSDRNFIDANGNGIVDSEDSVLLTIRRRTTELGPRSTSFNTDQFQFVTGVEGYFGDWIYDVSAQYGETNRVNGFAGYSNVDNIGKALNSIDGVTCRGGDSTCVPIDLFGGFGTITPEMAQYAQAVAFSRTQYEQRIVSASINGPIYAVVSPWADNELAMSFGYEYRNEEASFDPDLCLQLAPSSCLGGAGGNSLPVGGGFSVNEWYFEGLLPILQDVPFAKSLDFEFGYRYANYDTVGENDTWKLGLAYRPIDNLLLRIMDQRATRAPNVGELFAPVTSGLNNATIDPCSDANAANIDANLRQLCISTGMTDAQVGRVANIASSQVNAFSGSNPERLPEAEIADSLTVGLVFTPEIDGINNFQLSVDYYDIEVDGYIGTTSAQEVLDGCYTLGISEQCSLINRIGGELGISGAGIELFTSNLEYLKTEGIEASYSFALNIGDYGDLQFSGNLNRFLTADQLSSPVSTVRDCNGFYGTRCVPQHEMRATNRATWQYDDLSLSILWRFYSDIERETAQQASSFEQFNRIGSYSYFDLFANYRLHENVSLSFGIDNMLDKAPPVVGNSASTTFANTGNTFPGLYDVVGRNFRTTINISF